MKLIAISDTHGFHRSLEIPEGDILIHAGDLTRHGILDDVREFNDFLSARPQFVKFFGKWIRFLDIFPLKRYNLTA